MLSICPNLTPLLTKICTITLDMGNKVQTTQFMISKTVTSRGLLSPRVFASSSAALHTAFKRLITGVQNSAGASGPPEKGTLDTTLNSHGMDVSPSPGRDVSPWNGRKLQELSGTRMLACKTHSTGKFHQRSLFATTICCNLTWLYLTDTYGHAMHGVLCFMLTCLPSAFPSKFWVPSRRRCAAACMPAWASC